MLRRHILATAGATAPAEVSGLLAPPSALEPPGRIPLRGGHGALPKPAVSTIRGGQHTRVVHLGLHFDFFLRGRRWLPCSARRRAASSSAPERSPCSASHSATACKPSRTRNQFRAASVIHADMLPPSAVTARRNLGVHISVHRNGHLDGGGSSRHAENYTTMVVVFQQCLRGGVERHGTYFGKRQPAAFCEMSARWEAIASGRRCSSGSPQCRR